MASTIVRPIADALAAVLKNMGVTPAVKPSVWVPSELPKPLPAAVIELPEIERGESDDPEPELGATGWVLHYDVTLYCDMTNPTPGQDRAADVVENFIRAIDADPSLGGEVEFARVSKASPGYIIDQNPPMVSYEATVYVELIV